MKNLELKNGIRLVNPSEDFFQVIQIEVRQFSERGIESDCFSMQTVEMTRCIVSLVGFDEATAEAISRTS